MKTIASAVMGLGVLSLIGALGVRLIGYHQYMGANVSSLINGAMALYLLAMAVMMFDKHYGAPATPPKA